MSAHSIDWTAANWQLSNRSLAVILGVNHDTVSRMRTRYARETSLKLRVNRKRASGVEAPRLYMNTAKVVREIIAMLASGMPDLELIALTQRRLAAVATLCPCETELPDPGPHLPTCPWSDPEYSEAIP
jgi:hypothetical protein